MKLYSMRICFCRNITSSLQEWGFEVNPYGWFIENKMVNNEQLNMVCYVDDFKISFVDHNVVER